MHHTAPHRAQDAPTLTVLRHDATPQQHRNELERVAFYFVHVREPQHSNGMRRTAQGHEGHGEAATQQAHTSPRPWTARSLFTCAD